MALSIPGPATATIAMANRMLGNARRRSMQRIINVSAHPPQYPAHRPRSVPTSSAAVMEAPPIRSEIREPYIIRLRISRPKSSVPRGCSNEGGSSRAYRFCSMGSCGAKTGAQRATKRSRNRMPPPIIASRCFRSRFQISLNTPIRPLSTGKSFKLTKRNPIHIRMGIFTKRGAVPAR